MTRWSVVRRVGDAATLHAFDSPPTGEATLVVADLQSPALVLGSTQATDVVDQDRAHERALDVVRRRSGGSSVVLVPGWHIWIDVWIPVGDPLWIDDVVEAAVPIGEAWVKTLTNLGWTDLRVHAGGAEVAPWSDLICFAGRGPGEVITGDGRKLVGLSQRRTRNWIRMQCMVHRRWSAVDALAGLSLSAEQRSAAEIALRDAVAVVGSVDETALLDGLLDTLS